MTVHIQKPRALIFDWDNTLVDTWPTIHEALRQTFNAMDLEPWTLAETRQRVRKSMRESFPELFGSRWIKARNIFYNAYALTFWRFSTTYKSPLCIM